MLKPGIKGLSLFPVWQEKAGLLLAGTSEKCYTY